MVEVEHLMAMSDNAGNLIDEMVRWKYEVAQIVWPVRMRRVVSGRSEAGVAFYSAVTYGDWFETVFNESLEDYRARAERDKIGERIAADTPLASQR